MRAGRTFLTLQLGLGLLFALITWGILAASSPPRLDPTGVVRQKKDKKGKKRSEEEDDDKKTDDKKADDKKPEPPPKPKAKAKKRAEDEDDKPPVKPGVGRLDAEAEKQAPAKAATGDLAAALKSARNSRLKRLYRVLSVEHDELVLKRAKGVLVQGTTATGRLRIKPLSQYIEDLGELKGSLSFVVINDAGEAMKDRDDAVGPGRIESIRYYEQIAVDEVKDFLSQRFTNHATASDEYMGRLDQLTAAEFALSHVLRFHQSARETELRKGDAWDAVEKPLRLYLLEVLLLQMTELKDNTNFTEAFNLARKVLDTFKRPGDLKLIAAPLADLLRQALKDTTFSQEQLKEARARLKFLEEQMPNSDVLKPISESLQAQAKVYFDRAKKNWDEAEEKDKGGDKNGARTLRSEASASLKLAEEMWPELSGVRAFRIRIDQDYQVLQVGVRELPMYLSPGWAHTDSELRAVELLFESLVCRSPDEQGAISYRPALAENLPRVVPLGREFKLPRNARWSDDGPLGAADLRFTVRLLRDGKQMGRSPVWGAMLGEDIRTSGDSFRVKVPIRQGLLEPLAAMSFKLLPARGDPKEPTGREFALKPITSGPFEYNGRTSEPVTNRQYASFPANHRYGVRADKLNLPRIREVRLYPVLDAVKDLKAKQLDMALDLTAEQAADLRNDPEIEVPLPTGKSANRRVYFLAVNNYKVSMPEVRIALARAIGREQLLDDHFRKGLGKQVHKAVNGPYPAGSWACDPKLVSRADKTSLDAFDADLGRAKLQEAMAKGKPNLNLSLKYPAGDKPVEEAMRALCEQVGKELPGVTLTPVARPPHELRSDVEETQSYDLAYYFHDFADETFWLMPLLGAAGRGGGENYLRYTGSLVTKIQAADTLRHFSQVQEHARAMHRQFLQEEMPMIPLWQLDPLFAYRRGVVDVVPPLDPQLIFTRVEEWRVKRPGG